jgi:hypothetical protein
MVRNNKTVLPTGHPRKYTSSSTTQVSQADRIAQNEAIIAAGQRKAEKAAEKSAAEARAKAAVARAEADAARASAAVVERATAAQPRQVTSPWRDGPRWSAINGRPPRAWTSVPLRGRLWYLDFVYCTAAARLGRARGHWVLRWLRVRRCATRQTMRVW